MNKTAHPLMTEQELLDLPTDGMRHELIKGELRTKTPTGGQHGETTAWITHVLAGYILKHSLGRFFSAETGFILERNPDTVRASDLAFISKARFQSRTPKGFSRARPTWPLKCFHQTTAP